MTYRYSIVSPADFQSREGDWRAVTLQLREEVDAIRHENEGICAQMKEMHKKLDEHLGILARDYDELIGSCTELSDLVMTITSAIEIDSKSPSDDEDVKLLQKVAAVVRDHRFEKRRKTLNKP